MDQEPEIPYATILEPTWEEFQNFDAFVEANDKDRTLKEVGCYKVSPLFL